MTAEGALILMMTEVKLKFPSRNDIKEMVRKF